MAESPVPLSRMSNVTSRRERTESVCLRAHSLETVKKTCYRFASRYYSTIEVDAGGMSAIVLFSFPSTVGAEQEQEIIDAFRQDLLDQDLRTEIFNKTEIIRNLIFANAFENTSLVNDDD
jgi:His-Xaa-Ser system protein HxsD